MEDKNKLDVTEKKIEHVNENHASQMDALKERNASLKVALEVAKSAGEEKKSEDIRNLMKSLEENQTELFSKWQSETSELKGQLDEARTKEKTTKEKLRRTSVTVEKVRRDEEGKKRMRRKRPNLLLSAHRRLRRRRTRRRARRGPSSKTCGAGTSTRGREEKRLQCRRWPPSQPPRH